MFVAHYVFSNRSTTGRNEDRADWWWGRKHTLLASSGVTYVYDPIVGNSVLCGTTSYVRYLGKSALELTSPPFSVGFWFKLPATIPTPQALAGGGL